MRVVTAGRTVDQTDVAGVLGKHETVAAGGFHEYVCEDALAARRVAINIHLVIAVAAKEAVAQANTRRRRGGAAEKANAMSAVGEGV